MAGRLPVESRQLYVPPLSELRQVLLDGLAQNFAHAEVDVLDNCPDLREPPFHLAAPGKKKNHFKSFDAARLIHSC